MRIGSYDIEREIGTSGTGVIYEAVHLVLPRRAIIKVLHAAVATNAASAVALLREACILEALSHAGIPKVYDSGMLSDRRPWLATELADGPTLAAVTVGSAQLAELLRDIAEVLAFVHERGVVHGALRPQHIVLVANGGRYPVAIGDWASCRASGIPTFGSARAPSEYDAPECADGGGAIDGRADVFALGVIAAQAANEAEIDEALANLIEVMIEPNALHRPTMADVLEQLDAMTNEEDRVITSAKLPRPRWTPAPGALAPHVPAVAPRAKRPPAK